MVSIREWSATLERLIIIIIDIERIGSISMILSARVVVLENGEV